MLYKVVYCLSMFRGLSGRLFRNLTQQACIVTGMVLSLSTETPGPTVRAAPTYEGAGGRGAPPADGQGATSVYYIALHFMTLS